MLFCFFFVENADGFFDGPTKDPFSASADIYVMVSEYKHVQSYSYLHLYRGLR